MPDSSAPKATTDLNLLLGLLALQLDFITKEGLLAAMQEWLLEKQTPLAELLARNGALPPDRRLLLEALVREHLKQHGDDPQQSLASLSSVDSAKQQLGQLADPDLQSSLAPLLSSPVISMSTTQLRDGAVSTASVAVEGAPENTERFRVLRYHAEGGLGQVWVAEDSELHREVALKVIQPKKAHQSSLQTRFVLEAEITGGLEHPGIVPVYGLGHYADGRPFYAMKFIRGDSLKTAIMGFHERFKDSASFDPAAWNLELRKLLQRFLDVCNTVAYAHSRGVLHRDLKPGNVMIGKYGETLVVDWGLAKAVGERTIDAANLEEETLHPATSDSNETASGSAIGTPAYMPPEQADGRLSELGPHSDVYSLGATLYHMLTGRAPFEGTTREILDQVIAGRMTAPRDRSRRVPIGLSAICLKAMSRESASRYATPRDLALDIERWLADEAITARRDDTTVRIRRWIKRHQTLAASMTVGIVMLTGIGAEIVITRSREATALSNFAETSFARAEERLSLRDAVEAARLLNLVQGQLKNRPDLVDLAERAKSLSARSETLAQVEQRLQEYHRLSDSALQMEPANNLQSITESLAQFEKALSLFRVLDRDDWKAVDPFIYVAPEAQPGLADDISYLLFKYLEHQHRRGYRGALATGLGLQLYQSKTAPVQALRVQRITADSPASQAGLKVGDRLLEVAGKSWTEFKDSDAVRESLLGAPETPVELLVHRPGAPSNERITLTRTMEGRVGIGTQLVGTFVVGLIESGSAAEKAGVRSGDVLFDIDFHPAEGELFVGESSPWNFPYTGLFQRLRAGSRQRHLTLWRPADQKWYGVDLAWTDEAAARVERANRGILGLMMRQEFGAFLFALKKRPASLLKNLEIDDPDQPLAFALEQSFSRRGWPKDVVERVAKDVINLLDKQEHLLRALHLQADSKFDEAIQELHEHFRLQPRDPDATQLLIFALLQKQRWPELVEFTTHALLQRPNSATFYSSRAVAYRELKEFRLALRDARQALELNPNSEDFPKLIQELEDRLKQPSVLPTLKSDEPPK